MNDPTGPRYPRDKFEHLAVKCMTLQEQIDRVADDEHHFSKELVEILTKRMNMKLEKMDGWRKVHIMNCMKNQWTIEYMFTIQPKEYVAYIMKPPVWFNYFNFEQIKLWDKSRGVIKWTDPEVVERKRQEQVILEQGKRFAEAADIK